jgi:hypothetical protein
MPDHLVETFLFGAENLILVKSGYSFWRKDVQQAKRV